MLTFLKKYINIEMGSLTAIGSFSAASDSTLISKPRLEAYAWHQWLYELVLVGEPRLDPLMGFQTWLVVVSIEK